MQRNTAEQQNASAENLKEKAVPLLRRAYSSTVRCSSGGNDDGCCYTFLMPTCYPRYSEADYMNMPEATLDRLLDEYGLLDFNPSASLSDKRSFAVGAFLWK